MRKPMAAAGIAAALVLAGLAGAAANADTGSSGDLTTLDLPKADWLTPELEAQIVAAGPRGVDVPAAQLEPNCLGYSPPYAGTDGASVNAVSAGGCMVSPHGCTLNFQPHRLELLARDGRWPARELRRADRDLARHG